MSQITSWRRIDRVEWKRSETCSSGTYEGLRYSVDKVDTRWSAMIWNSLGDLVFSEENLLSQRKAEIIVERWIKSTKGSK